MLDKQTVINKMEERRFTVYAIYGKDSNTIYFL